MRNCWAIAIGINQYQLFQPLLYAERDAEGLHGFLINEAGVPGDRCLLLTDNSPPVQNNFAEPSRTNIQETIKHLCQERLQPGDLLWCFFSGYGVRFQGQDYLMPIEGDARQVPGTGVSVQSLFDSLRSSPTQNIVLVLDINRSQGTMAGDKVGEHTAQLAQDLGIATLLSCQPDQFSHETTSLQHGLFTAALLEGLRLQQCRTLEQLTHYVGDRLPEISRHHWRPTQDPLVVIPPGKQDMVILPENGLVPGEVVSTNGIDRSRTAVDEADGFPTLGAGRAAVSLRSGTATLSPSQTLTTAPDNENVAATQRQEAIYVAPELVMKPVEAPKSSPSVLPALPIDAPGSEPEPEIADDLFWRRFLLWGGIILLVLLLGALLRILPTLVSGDPAGQDSSATSSPPVDAESLDAQPPDAQPPDTQPQVPFFSSQQSALENARQAQQQQRYEDAALWLDQVPVTQRTQEYAVLRAEIEQAANQSGQLDQTRLNQARSLIRFNQASSFNRAINEARQIRPGQAAYEQAQQDIDRWSRVMLDLAEGRAREGNYRDAIAAARLIPDIRQDVYATAQQRITQWQQQQELAQKNQALIEAAQELPRRGQASSYNDAIRQLSIIQPDQPQYAAARRLIEQWSQRIFEIASSRAAQGRLESAIAAATLIPENTPAYNPAQTKIADWRQRLAGN